MKINLKSKKVKNIKLQKTEEKDKGGRPTKYDPKYCKLIIKYFDLEPYTIKRVEAFGKKFDKKVPSDLPLLCGFAAKIDVDRDTLKEWAKVHPEFSAAYKKAKELQEKLLVVNTMNGSYNPAFAIFAAKNILGWRDKVEHSGNIDSNIKTDDKQFNQLIRLEHKKLDSEGSSE
jgi:hypothetical protein